MAATTFDYADPSTARSPAIAEALAYWQSKRVGDAIPQRAQIDPLEMRSFLGKVLLVRQEANDRFIFQLCGTHVRDLNGADLTGRYAGSDSLGESADLFIDSYRRALSACQPVFFRTSMFWQQRGYATFEQVNLPLSSDGIATDKLLCVIDADLPRGAFYRRGFST